jgi:NAD(P)-dependent dehydrogenase (short-subunit alcohol dehydrogenase family)
MSEAFALAGAKLTLASNEPDACRQLEATLRAQGVEVTGVPTDVRSADELRHLVDVAIQQFGRIDVLVCNAGIPGPLAPLAQVSDAEYDDAFQINLRHPVRLTGYVAPLMALQGAGSIILTSSIAGLRGNAHLGVYAMTKAALTQLARNVAVEYGACNVRANAIAPGLIATSWVDSILHSPEASAARLKQTPLRRIGAPWEIAATALFLAGPGAAFITGQTLIVDGGTVISDGS